jgi:UDP-galactopyranose mutase
MSVVDPDTGIEVHCYGSHLFHCNSKEVWTFINQFGAFSDYRHHVFTNYGGKIYPMPINLGTICSFFGRAMTPREARALIARQAQEISTKPENFLQVGCRRRYYEDNGEDAILMACQSLPPVEPDFREEETVEI